MFSSNAAWVLFGALTVAVIALVAVFANLAHSGGSVRSRERAEREAGHAIPSEHRARPQNQTRVEGESFRP